jgi:hypothetical protein
MEVGGGIAQTIIETLKTNLILVRGPRMYLILRPDIWSRGRGAE